MFQEILESNQLNEAQAFLFEWEKSGHLVNSLPALKIQLEKKINSVKEIKAKNLINSGKFEEAEKFISSWETNDLNINQITKLNNF